MNALYLWVDLAVLLPTLLLSFDRRVAFYKQWRSYWPVNAAVLAGFVAWDVLFTERGVWGFNPDYLVGIDLLGLPIEEWGFFIAVPYACTFTYATLKQYVPSVGAFRFGARSVTLAVWLFSAWLAWAFAGQIYPATTATILFLTLSFLLFRPNRWFGHFWFAYAVLLIPFIISNGVLTGIDFTAYPLLHREPEIVADQIVWYNNDENTRWRIFSMPADDLVYGLLLMVLHVAGLEALERRSKRNLR